jgi:hypothetical protein
MIMIVSYREMKGTYIDSTTGLKYRTSGYCRQQHGEVREMPSRGWSMTDVYGDCRVLPFVQFRAADVTSEQPRVLVRVTLSFRNPNYT